MAQTNPKIPLNIGIFTDDFYPKSGGVARSIELQIAELVRLGHRVVLFAPQTFFIPPEHCESEALKVWRIPGTPSYSCSIQFGKKLARRIADQYKFDVVHSQNERGAMFLASRIAQLLHVPHVHTFHSNYAGTHRTTPIAAAINSMTFMNISPLIMHLLRADRDHLKIYFPRHLSSVESSHFARADWKNVAKLARYTDHFTSPADYMIHSINDASRGELAYRSHVVPNGIDKTFTEAERIRPQEDVVRFLSCGRLDPEKRVDTIIRAFAKLGQKNSELYILGKGSQDAELRRLADKIVKKGTVTFLGHFNDIERIANEFANADCFVFASYRFDTQGMVLAEAAAAGTAILYCDDRLTVGVTPANALLTHPSVSSIADGMRTLFHDPDQLRTMGNMSKRVGRGLTSRDMEDSFVTIYRRAIDEKQS